MPHARKNTTGRAIAYLLPTRRVKLDLEEPCHSRRVATLFRRKSKVPYGKMIKDLSVCSRNRDARSGWISRQVFRHVSNFAPEPKYRERHCEDADKRHSYCGRDGFLHVRNDYELFPADKLTFFVKHYAAAVQEIVAQTGPLALDAFGECYHHFSLPHYCLSIPRTSIYPA
jgi:hypothetical protein